MPVTKPLKFDRAMRELKMLAPSAGSYVAESDYFEPNWQRSYWRSNYPCLLEIKQKYDPQCLFFVWHGVGTEPGAMTGSPGSFDRRLSASLVRPGLADVLARDDSNARAWPSLHRSPAEILEAARRDWVLG